VVHGNHGAEARPKSDEAEAVGRHQRRRSRVVRATPSRSEKAGPAPVVAEAVHTYRVELSLEDPNLVFVALGEAPNPDEAAQAAGLRLREIVKDRHFITHFHTTLVDEESVLPAQRRGAEA
jgi:hypothetical protein